MACSVPTGWGSAVYAGGTRPGDTVVVVGLRRGGRQRGAGRGARRGVEHRRRRPGRVPPGVRRVRRRHARRRGHPEPPAKLARELTRGNGADVVVLAVGATDAEATRRAARCLGKGGTLVLTALADIGSDVTVSLQGNGLTVYEHRIQGALFGSCNAHRDVPMLLRLASEGKLELDRLVTRRYALDQLDQGFADQAAGETIRGLLVHAD